LGWEDVGLDEFDRFVAEIQREIDEQARAIYSAKVIEEAYQPSNVGRMVDADVRGLVHGWCGDTMEVFLRLDGERISQAQFVTDGCGPTLACGSMLTKMIHGMSMGEAGEILPEDVIAALDGLPEESLHCAELAVSTLQNAIFDWRGLKGPDWISGLSDAGD
jgi:nitrogen fixation NifU-like protein